MASKQYQFFVTEREAWPADSSGKKIHFPDYISPTFKNKRKATEAAMEFHIIEGHCHGGSATLEIKRTR